MIKFLLLLLIFGVVISDNPPNNNNNNNNNNQPHLEYGDYVCTEQLKADFDSMFLVEDTFTNAHDMACMCELCSKLARTALLIVNDDRYYKSWMQLSRDRVCKYTEIDRRRDCLRMWKVIEASQAPYFESAAAKFTKNQTTSSISLAYTSESFAFDICKKWSCCVTPQMADLGKSDLKGRSMGTKQNTSSTSTNKKSTSNTNNNNNNNNVKPNNSSTNSTINNNNQTINRLNTMSKEQQVADRHVTTGEMAGLSIDEREERLTRDKLQLERDQQLIKKMRESIVAEEHRLEKLTREVMLQKQANEEALSTGQMHCKSQQLLAQCPIAPEKVCDDCDKICEEREASIEEQERKEAEKAGKPPPPPRPKPKVKSKNHTTTPAPTPAPTKKDVTPIKFREINRNDPSSYISNVPKARSILPLNTGAMPKLPAGWQWQYKYVPDNK